MVEQTENENRLASANTPGETVAVPKEDESLSTGRISRLIRLFAGSKPEHSREGGGFDFASFECSPFSRHVVMLWGYNSIIQHAIASWNRTRDFEAQYQLARQVAYRSAYHRLYHWTPESISSDEPSLKDLADKTKSTHDLVSMLWSSLQSPRWIDALALAGDQEEIRTDFAVAVIRLFGQTEPSLLVYIGHKLLDENRADEIPPRAREALAKVFEDYAQRLRSSGSENRNRSQTMEDRNAADEGEEP